MGAASRRLSGQRPLPPWSGAIALVFLLPLRNLRDTVLEKRYGLLSADFHHLYKAGELEQSRDFIQWVGYYEAKLEREARYREMMYAYLRELRGKAGLGALHLAPETTPPGAS